MKANSPGERLYNGVGVIAFFMGRFVERKKWMKDEN